jgi:hypothetical protein
MLDRIFISALGLVLFPALSLRAIEPTASPATALSANLSANLIARGEFSVPTARAGDTVEYRLRVEWRDVPAAIMVLPPRDELKTPGFKVIGQSALHRKIASAGAIRNVSEFSYLLVAREEGQGRIAPFLLRYRNTLSERTDDRVESIPVAGSTLEIGPRYIPWMQRNIVVGGAAFLAVGLTAGLLLSLSLKTAKRARRRAQGGEQGPEQGEVEDEFTRAVASLKNRSDSADSRLWLRDAEKLCVAYLCRDLGVTKARDVRFEAALDQYLARHPGSDESWVKLRDLFHEARYAGGRKDPYELREACRHMKTVFCKTGET